jgi:hypothetical protein
LDEPADTHSSELDSDPDNTQTKKGRNFTPSIIDEGIIAGQKIAKISVATLVSIGIVELIMGYFIGM